MNDDGTKMEPLPSTVNESPPSQSPAATVETIQRPSPVSISTASTGVRIRPKICDVRNCDSNSLRNPEILFISVPGHSYPERRFVWLTLMQAVRDKKRSYCCSRHFKVPDDFKDFQEFISAPPGYKRQLLVKKGVVPHLNMPPLDLSALPPLTDRWQMTLPPGLTEAEKRQNVARSVMPATPEIRSPPFPLYKNNRNFPIIPIRSQMKCSKAVQTDSSIISGNTIPRKVAPSLQYCRLCLKRQDLEPIFTGDQTLIEPDLIDKIFRCTEVWISVQIDFPSSICTDCYASVHEFVKFQKLVQQNDQSLRGTSSSDLHKTPTRSPTQLRPQTNAVRTKTTEMIPNRPTMKVTPVRPVNSAPPAPRQEDSLLEVQRVENVEDYQRRQRAIERNQPLRVQRMQDTLFPVPYRGSIAEHSRTNDPLANTEKINSESVSSSTLEGVQLNDRIVPVTLIRVQQEATEPDLDESELYAPSKAGIDSFNTTSNSEEVTIKSETPEEQLVLKNPVVNTIRPKPLHQLMANPHKRRENPPNVLQAVKLLPSASVKEISNQKTSIKPVSTLTRGITSGRFVHRVWKPTVEKTLGRTLPKSLARGVRFPGTLTTLFSGIKKSNKPSTPSASENIVEKPKTVTSTPTAISEQTKQTQAIEKPQTPIKMRLPTQPSLLSSITKQKTSIPTIQPSKQKENAVPEKPREVTPSQQNTPSAKLPVKFTAQISVPKMAATPKPSEKPQIPTPAKLEGTPPSPRTSRTRKVPLKFQDTVGFPMPKIISIKSEPENKNVEDMKVTGEPPNDIVTRTTRRSHGVEEKTSEIQTLVKSDRKQPEVRSVEKKKQPKHEEPPKKEIPVVRTTRSSDVVIKNPEVQQTPKPIKRKSDIKSNASAKEGPTPSKSPKVEPTRNSVDTPSAKTQQQQKNKLADRANGSKSKSASTADAQEKKSKKIEPPCTVPVSSQDWKCPFCPDKVFDQKKGLVKHLRKRHGMDYALVRQRLAIYGGNWR